MNHRFRGRTGQGDDGKYYFEISMWNFEGTEMIGDPFGNFGPFESDEIAKVELQKAVEFCCKSYADAMGKEMTGYVDMKNGGEFIPLVKH